MKKIKSDELSKLTEMEIKILEAARCDSCFGDYLECHGNWSFSICDSVGIPEKQYRGVISSLIKKGYIQIWDYENESPGKFRNSVFDYTKKGAMLFNDWETFGKLNFSEPLDND